MRRRLLILIALLALASPSSFAQNPEFLAGLTPYRPERAVTGTIRSWGNNYIIPLMSVWEEAFRKHHPALRFETTLQGTETAIAGLYSGVADLGFMGREIYQPESMGFEGWFRYKPLGIEVTTGSYNNPHKTFALMVFVHKDNPLSRITLAQVAAIFGCDCKQGAKRLIRTWGRLGLTGEWAERPIHVYGYGLDSGFARFFRMVVLKDSYKWNSELHEFYSVKAADGSVIKNASAPVVAADGSVIDGGQLMLDALAKDPYGIAYANVRFMNPSVKTLAVASKDGGPFIEPTKENVWKRAYPITRFTNVFINRAPGRPVDPKVKEFLRYILSRDGQEAVVREGSYLPLTADLIRDQLRKLE
jgi:phosphate transport system substrate-binding protein